MKRISISILIAILFTACGGNSSSATVSDPADSNSASSSSGANGDASFSYNLDGQKVSGGEVDLTNNVFFYN